MTDNNSRSHAQWGRVWFNAIAILGALWLGALVPIAPAADGSETHGAPIKPHSAAMRAGTETV